MGAELARLCGDTPANGTRLDAADRGLTGSREGVRRVIARALRGAADAISPSSGWEGHGARLNGGAAGSHIAAGGAILCVGRT